MRLLGMDTCPSLNDIMEMYSKRAGVRLLNLPSCMPCVLLVTCNLMLT